MKVLQASFPPLLKLGGPTARIMSCFSSPCKIGSFFFYNIFYAETLGTIMRYNKLNDICRLNITVAIPGHVMAQNPMLRIVLNFAKSCILSR